MRLRRKRHRMAPRAALLAGIGAGVSLIYLLYRSRREAARKKHAGRAPADEILADRVRTKIGEFTGHAERVAVSAHGGWVTLSGPVLAEELGSLVSSVRLVRGVRGVENLLEIHESEEAR
jgi:osmotically-inducible protein OsmY